MGDIFYKIPAKTANKAVSFFISVFEYIPFEMMYFHSINIQSVKFPLNFEVGPSEVLNVYVRTKIRNWIIFAIFSSRLMLKEINIMFFN